jgi:hypothetical protein
MPTAVVMLASENESHRLLIYTSSAGFLNGRKLTDDVIDISLTLVTNGKITTDKVGPHTDYLNESLACCTTCV